MECSRPSLEQMLVGEFPSFWVQQIQATRHDAYFLPSVSAWMSMYTLDRVDDACRKMATETIVQALGASGDLEDGDLPAITQALEQKGYSSSTKVGAGFRELDTSTLVPPLTVRQANVVKAIQRPGTGKLLSQSTLLSVCFHVRGSTSRACKRRLFDLVMLLA